MADPQGWGPIIVDRRDHTSPFRQIANAIRHRIATNQLPANTPLPSVRSLASQARVTPTTVARAYRELQMDGLVESQVGVGTVVSDTNKLLTTAKRRSTEELELVIDQALTALLQRGYTPDVIRVAVRRRLETVSSTRHLVVALEKPVGLEKYVAAFTQELGGMGVEVHGVLLDKLNDVDAATRVKLRDAQLIMTSLSTYRSVSDALARVGFNVPVAVIFKQLTMASIERLAAIPSSAKTLLVAREWYRTAALDILHEYLPLENLEVLSDLESADALQDALARNEVVVYSLGVRDRVQGALDVRHEPILLEYEVRQDAMGRVRAWFANLAAVPDSG